MSILLDFPYDFKCVFLYLLRFYTIQNNYTYFLIRRVNQNLNKNTTFYCCFKIYAKYVLNNEYNNNNNESYTLITENVKKKIKKLMYRN